MYTQFFNEENKTLKHNNIIKENINEDKKRNINKVNYNNNIYKILKKEYYLLDFVINKFKNRKHNYKKLKPFLSFHIKLITY